jgi:hypothetical protein
LKPPGVVEDLDKPLIAEVVVEADDFPFVLAPN